MIPMHFGSSGRLLYGVYHPAGVPRLRRGVVLLNPYGWEALRAHRTLRTLALRLAKAGLDTLRFDYSCTGDSLGDSADASWDDWIEDADYAVEELQAMANVRKVSLLGLRMGALLAAELAERRRDAVDRLVLWAPPSGGREVAAWARSGPQGEVAAFPMGGPLEEQLSARRLPKPSVPTLALLSEPGQLTDELPLDAERLPLPSEEPRCWVEDRDFGAGAVPADLVDRVTTWLIP